MSSNELGQYPPYDASPPKYEPPPPMASQQPVPQQYMYNAGYNQQPGATQLTVNVITQQPQQVDARSWSTTMCGCFDDIGSCCCVTWFCPCYTCCSISPQMGESCFAPICLTMFGHSVPMVYRTKVRAAHGIMGGAIDDCCSTLFCAPCVMCQMKRELDYVERATGKPAFR